MKEQKQGFTQLQVGRGKRPKIRFSSDDLGISLDIPSILGGDARNILPEPEEGIDSPSSFGQIPMEHLFRVDDSGEYQTVVDNRQSITQERAKKKNEEYLKRVNAQNDFWAETEKIIEGSYLKFKYSSPQVCDCHNERIEFQAAAPAQCSTCRKSYCSVDEMLADHPTRSTHGHSIWSSEFGWEPSRTTNDIQVCGCHQSRTFCFQLLSLNSCILKMITGCRDHVMSFLIELLGFIPGTTLKEKNQIAFDIRSVLSPGDYY